jgi:hypothetical protein
MFRTGKSTPGKSSHARPASTSTWEQYLDAGARLHFSDSAPDRWGRMLMERREAAEADREGRPMKVLGMKWTSRWGGARYRLHGCTAL